MDSLREQFEAEYKEVRKHLVNGQASLKMVRSWLRVRSDKLRWDLEEERERFQNVFWKTRAGRDTEGIFEDDDE